MPQSLNFLIPNNYATIVNEHINTKMELFISNDEFIRANRNLSPFQSVKLTRYAIQLNNIKLYIDQRNLEIYNAINFRLPNQFDPDFLQKYFNWD